MKEICCKYVLRFSCVVLMFFLACGNGFSQGLTIPEEYHEFVRLADSLAENKSYNEASINYRKAFIAFGWRGTPDDRYKAARIFGLMRNYDSTIISLSNLCTTNRYWNYLKVERDSAFRFLKRSKRWRSLIDCMKKNKEKDAQAINLEWFNFLDTVSQEDLRYRIRLFKIQTAAHYDTVFFHYLMRKMAIADSINIIKVTGFIDKFGWQSSKVVGYSGNSALFLVIQHSNIELQEKYLPIIRAAAEKQMVSLYSLALLEDRISVNKKGYQIYGSQLEWDPVTSKYSLFPIKDEVDVNQRRKKMGMEPLEEYVKQFGVTYMPIK